MMRKVDYIIVGDGYAALFFAHQLVMKGKPFLLFSEGKKAASRVSAGIVNPLVLKKFTTFWLAQQQIDFLTKTLAEIETYTGRNYLINEKIHRIFHDAAEKSLWLKKADSEDLKPFLNPTFTEFETIKNPFGCGTVNFSARLDVDAFFTGVEEFFVRNEIWVKERFDYEALQENMYRDIHFDHLVFCEGMGVRKNPFFSDIPLVPNKGHHLKVKLSSQLSHRHTLKKKHFLFPLDEHLHYYGGTYDPNERREEIDDFAVNQLTEGLSEIYPEPFEVVEVNFGFRPTVKDRRPILGSHPEFKNYYVFNGLGARGILNGCYFAKELYDHIEYGKPLLPEIDLRRF